MILNNIIIQNFEWVDDRILSFDLLPTDELIGIADGIRESKGYKDKTMDPGSDVWYEFYLDVDIVQQTVTMWFQCNNGDKDDYANYDIEINETEKEQFVWKAFRQFAK